MRNGIVFAILCVGLLFMECANSTGGSTETSSKIASMLYNPGGSPAASAKVYFRHHDNDPRPGFDSGVVDSTTTDANGNYSVTLDPGTYTIEASGDSGLAYMDSVTVINDSTVRPDPDTLKPAGTIRGVVRFEEGGDPTTIFILFMGTRTFTWPDDTFGNFSSG
ncbi:MAG: carboxypeptidase regulatory-like domain-containing protein, partial [Chitinispirillaceae bacterium]|nr:carboxypeptidase regulatory-like domain-containing protein [Chitinispirillaceae bacterium]